MGSGVGIGHITLCPVPDVIATRVCLAVLPAGEPAIGVQHLARDLRIVVRAPVQQRPVAVPAPHAVVEDTAVRLNGRGLGRRRSRGVRRGQFSCEQRRGTDHPGQDPSPPHDQTPSSGRRSYFLERLLTSAGGHLPAPAMPPWPTNGGGRMTVCGITFGLFSTRAGTLSEPRGPQ